MAKGNGSYREGEVGRLTRIGVITLVMLGLAGPFFSTYARRDVRADNAGPYARTGGSTEPARNGPAVSQDFGDRIRNGLNGGEAPPRSTP